MSIEGLAPITPLKPISLVEKKPATSQRSPSDFGTVLQKAIQEVDALQKQGEEASIGLLTGQVQDVHTAVIALEKASLSMSLTVEVRNKVLDAYQEMMRMQI